ncbi:MAG: polysaccharide deacetylase family protein [Gammaproteobacteria bacterium]|jgi:peptidoglycan/xylan/chitin deacetylase (PgdA/CDA1 family)
MSGKISLLLSSLLFSLPVMAASHCVILQYHHFSDSTPGITSVTPKQFDDHLDYLERHDFRVLPLRDVVEALAGKQPLPDRCVSLTVDDAYISVYHNAFPELEKRGWPLTVFVNTEAVDQGIPSYMSWDQIRELARQGVTFENHGHGHIHMIRKHRGESDENWRQRIIRDIKTAQQRLTEETGVAPRLFAHPYGEYSPATLEIISNMGLGGFGQQSGPAWPGADIRALPRFPMAATYAEMQSFITKVNSLPLPLVAVEPADPVVPLGLVRPVLTLRLKPGNYSKSAIQCYVDGSSDVAISWSSEIPGQFTVIPDFDLGPGRHRTNCAMPSVEKGRFHWYSHNWFIRKDDGGWYAEY